MFPSFQHIPIIPPIPGQDANQPHHAQWAPQPLEPAKWKWLWFGPGNWQKMYAICWVLNTLFVFLVSNRFLIHNLTCYTYHRFLNIQKLRSMAFKLTSCWHFTKLSTLASQRRTASLLWRLLSAHSLGGPSGAKAMATQVKSAAWSYRQFFDMSFEFFWYIKR